MSTGTTLKQMVKIETDRPLALREAITNVRSGGTASVIGAYGGFVDMFPMVAVMNRGLTIKSAQCPVQHSWQDLLKVVEDGGIDPSFIVTHQLPLQEAPDGYEMFKKKLDDFVKVVLKPN